ncbi:acyl-CoA synthetase (AMP-forming)/AMP-acid ligase II [Xenococcus sp. PCC 7305]|uniref:fatty acyl-AMP ligase n=1 Tax=Xenococcus sp. PCC 7305 TaxID=102125 RepID=UPI0002AC2570|nr:fatty acyl-AMP ligase [Xenococcus sp. PCC 7305]ELS02022.1 acyl-CoA synthetase (AMP-forming)/AMP-acid ligase II [Xenococcus sp. PCC 7305]
MSGLENTIAADTLIDILQYRASSQPDQTIYTFLVDGETEEITLTYKQLNQKAKAIAAGLQSLGAPQERILLLYPPGLGFIEAFFGCLYAGAIAIPAYPPRPNRSITRIQSIIKDAQPTLALTTNSILNGLQRRVEQAPELKTLRWLATDDLEPHHAAKWQKTPLSVDDIAFLQYTSGSTAEPKGVKIAHHNLLHNLQAIHQCFQHTTQSQGVIWLPPYHDMGLIGGVLQPLFGDFPVVLMSPLIFLQNPLRWLKAISRYRGTTSGGPNFAYDLCVRKFQPELDLDLDLSSWDLAFNGAEPINYASLEKFATTFRPYGFRPEAFYPCYGMAEATLIISGGNKKSLATTKTISSKELEQNLVVEAFPTDEDSRTLVSCGHSLADQQVAIVDPQSLTSCPSGKIGEIWVTGPSIAEGYWSNSEITNNTFEAQLPEIQDLRFLRTGDLGFIDQGELFVTGRLKDVIIIKGRNHYPQDIERTVEACNQFIRPSSVASFAIAENEEDQLVVLAEVDRHYWHGQRNSDQSPEEKAAAKAEKVQQLVQIIRSAISKHHDLQTHSVLILKSGAIPKTSSGKIQRHICRDRFLRNEF